MQPVFLLRSITMFPLSFGRRHPIVLASLVVVVGILYAWSRLWTSEEHPVDPQFSSNGSVFAVIWVQDYFGVHIPNPGGPTPKSRSARFSWAETAHSDRIRSIDLGTMPGAGHAGTLAFRLAPDSRHAAVVANGRLHCIDLKTAQRTPLSKERESVTALAWLDNGELLYAAHVVAQSGTASTRLFYRQSITQGPEKRSLIGHPAGVAIGFEGVCSPRGGYVLFTNRVWKGELFLLDVRRGIVTTLCDNGIAQRVSLPGRVAWKMDDSAALCVIDKNAGPQLVDATYRPPVPGALLIDPAAGTVEDVSEPLARCFKERVWPSPLWTPDGKYCIFNGGHYVEPLLICPRPWSVLSPRKPTTVPANNLLGWSPVPGTVYDRNDLVRYDGTKLMTWRSNEILSPDGKYVARLNNRGGFSISPSGLPAQP